MKIAYIVTRAHPIGGVQVHVRDLALALLKLGHEPVVVTSGNGAYTDGLREAGVETISLSSMGRDISPLQDLRAFRDLQVVLKRLKPDLVSTHSAKAGILGRLAARSVGLPVIFTAHGWTFTTGVPAPKAMLYGWIERMVAPLALKIITVCDSDRELAISRGVGSPDKLVTIHNGMPDIPSALRADPSRTPVRLSMVARFESQKDHATLIRALAGLKSSDWHLDLIGDGPLQPKAKELCQRLGLADRVEFWGQRLDVAARLAEAQVALLITKWEGFPRSILEAMRAGLPVIASAVGGVAESVWEGETGFIVRPGDVAGLRERLELLLADPELRCRMGRRARELYEREFMLTRTVNRTLEVYHEIVGRGSEATVLQA